MSKKTFDARQDDENKEGYDTVKTGLPKERFQESKQVLNPDELGVAKSSIPGDEKAVTTSNLGAVAKQVKSKMKIAPDVSVEELKNTQVGGVPLAVTPGMRAVAGVSSQSPADDQSKIPYTKGDYRPATRYGKKRSDDLFEIDNTISEQIAPVVDDAHDLKDAPEAKQGYNGRKQFTQTRGKKNFVDSSNGKIPQQLLNEASVDFAHTSKIVYTCGQMIDGIDSQADYPTVRDGGTAVVDNSGNSKYLGKGNYIPRAFNFTIANGKITSVSITEERVEVKADPVTRDQANLNWQIDSHNVAKAMVKLQKELGRETTDKWSPLGYVINEPYQYNMLMHDIEATTGAIQAIAYRAAVSSMAYQRNILAKDGVGPQKNAVKMILEGYAGVLKNSTSAVLSDTDFSHVIFREGTDKAAYREGSVAALINMFDSVKKYKTKADLLGLQRSLALHLSQADNNINPLHCKPQFIKALDKSHYFSTITGNYNPMLPIFSTRKMHIVNPLSLNMFLIGWKNPALLTATEQVDPLRDANTGTYAKFAYAYKDVRNTYTTRVQHPIIEGLLRWMLKHEGAIVSTYGDGTTQNPVTVSIPFEFNFEAPNMMAFMLCSASQDVLWERNICFRDILFAGEQMTYVWDDLMGLDKLNPLYSSQLTIGKYDQPLKLGKLAPDAAIREMWPTHMCLTDTDISGVNNAKAQYCLPWYFNEVAYTNSFTSNEGFNNEVSAFNMTIPSVRDGVRHEYVDLVKSMDERDVRLSLDRWLRAPIFVKADVIKSTYTGTPDLYTYHHIVASNSDINSWVKLSALRYELNSDGRVVATYTAQSTATDQRHLTQYSLLAIPKELGWVDEDYLGEKVITGMSYSNNALTLSVTNLSPVSALDSANMYNGYSPLFISSYRVEANSANDGSIDRAAALSQVFYNCFAATGANQFNTEFITATGIIPCLSYNNAAPSTLAGHYTLNGSTPAAAVLDSNVSSIAPRMWSGIQRIFFPVNRFENCFTFDNSKTAYDPLEGAFYFGVCGTLASDYTQDILERLDIYDQLGLDYTEDVFVKDSLLFR